MYGLDDTFCLGDERLGSGDVVWFVNVRFGIKRRRGMGGWTILYPFSAI